MTITVRIDEQTKQRLEQHAAALGLPVDEVIARAIQATLEGAAEQPVAVPRKTPYEAWLELGVDFTSGESDRSERHSEIIREMIEDKHRSQLAGRRQ